MNFALNILIYSLFAGGGSIALSHFIDPFFQPIAIGSVMVVSVFTAAYDLVSDGKSVIRLQMATNFWYSENKYDVEKDEHSGVYFALGAVCFGMLALIFL